MPEKAMAYLLAGLIICLDATSAFAQEPPAFTAICTTNEARRFDLFYTYAGEKVGPEWSENENFFSPDWAITYKGGETIEIGGQPYPALIFSPELLLAIEPSENTVAVSLWTYAINLAMKEVVATQVNSNVGSAPALKARIVSFDCKWSFH